MKPIPSSLNNILRTRYLQEAVDTASPISYRKREDEETTQQQEPFYVKPPSPEIDDVRPLPPEDYPGSPAKTTEPPPKPKPAPFVPQKPQRERRMGEGGRAGELADRVMRERQRMEQIKQTKKGLRQDIRLSSDLPFEFYEDEFGNVNIRTKPVPFSWKPSVPSLATVSDVVSRGIKGVGGYGMDLALGYPAYAIGSEMADIEALPNDLIGDPVQVTAGLAAAEATIPYLKTLVRGAAMNVPETISAVNQFAPNAAYRTAVEAVKRVPVFAIPYATAYGYKKLHDYNLKQNEPLFSKMMQDFENEQAKLETQRRKEGREESTWEKAKRIWAQDALLKMRDAGPQYRDY